MTDPVDPPVERSRDDQAIDQRPHQPPVDPGDIASVSAQLGRAARGVAAVAWRCPCGKPGVVATEPRLSNGTPFPTTYYLTCPRATSACSTLESEGLMVTMTERLRSDPELAAAYARAHEAYLADREVLGRATVGAVPEIAGVSAGGMPDRVKCLHVLAGHALATGPGTNPLGDEVVEQLGEFWSRPCLDDPDHDEPIPADANSQDPNRADDVR